MITNSKLTIYHKTGIDAVTRYEKYARYNYSSVWYFSTTSATINNGYTDNNNVKIRIPYDKNTGLSASNFAVGDIIVKGELKIDIETQEDLKGYEIYNITSINDNNFGNNPHIHIGGK